MASVRFDIYSEADSSEKLQIFEDLKERGYTPMHRSLGDYEELVVKTPSKKIISREDIEVGLAKLTFGNPNQIALIKASQLLALGNWIPPEEIE